jgi:ribosome-binding factor A
MPSYTRINRVSDEIQKAVNISLNNDIRDPRLKLISITGVELSGDFSTARVYFSLVDQSNTVEDASKAFRFAKGFFRTILSKRLSLRKIPSLHFIHDSSLDYGYKIEELISKALSEDRDTSEESTEYHSNNSKNEDRKRERLR